MEKLYAYADETGQDTRGGYFLVAVVVVGTEREELQGWLLEVERATKKQTLPWRRARREARIAYVDQILMERRLAGSVFFSSYPETRAYRDLTLVTIAKAIGAKAGKQDYRATVVIDGLRRAEERAVGVGLRRLRVRIRRIRGARAESDPLVRLADAMAGFIRDVEEGDADLRERYERALRRGLIQQV